MTAPSVGPVPTVTISRLPGEVGAEVVVYLRPIGLAAGNEAEALLASGAACRLTDGPFTFAACQVYLREPGRIRTVVASIAEIERWTAGLPAVVRDRTLALLGRLTGRRRDGLGLSPCRPAIMAIVNVTPDSFSDGGEYLDPALAVARARRLAADGAAILDIGGESTRPGAEPVTTEVELDRVTPVLQRLAADRKALGSCRLSIDTHKVAVMRAALAAGAVVINDVSALTADPQSLAVAAGSGATVVLMHKQGEPREMNRAPRYEDAPLDIFDDLEARIAVCTAAGIPTERLIVDPGIGFGKTGDHNLAILRSLSLFHGLGCPLLLGLSRKGLTGDLDRRYGPSERLPGSLAAAVWALNQGVQILRVHDVAETRQAIDVWAQIAGVADD